MVSVDLLVYGVVAVGVLFSLGIVWLLMGDILTADLRASGRRLGIRWWDAAPVTVVAVAGLGSVFALGGETTGRGDLDFGVAGAVFILGLLGVAVALGNLDEFWLVRRTPTTDAVSVGAGMVEVAGEARPADGTVETPFGKRQALCHRWRIEEEVGHGRRESMGTFEYGAGGGPFFVDDGTGQVCVDPTGGDLRLGEEHVEAVDADEDLPEAIREFIADRPDVAFGGEDRRFVESHLPPGDDVVVIGEASHTFSGDYPDDTVIGAGDDAVLVAAGTPESVTRDLRRRVVYGGGVGAVATVVGYLGMLVLSGAV